MNAKLSILATACVLAGSALAQQGAVTLYGVADVGITSVNGYRQGTVNRVNSGIMEGSRWGVRVNEDIGGGWRALATMEGRIEMDSGGLGNRPVSGTQLPDRVTAGLLPEVATAVTGAIGPTLGVNVNNAIFDRQVWVGLVTPVGGFLAGRQYSPAFEVVGSFDIMQTQSALSAGQLLAIPVGAEIRVNNSVQYRLVQGPISAAAMASFESNTQSRFLGLNAIYKTDKFSAGFGHNQRENSAGQRALRTTVFGASTNVGKFALSGMYADINEANPTGGPELYAGLTNPALPTPLPVPVANAIIDRLKQDGNLIHAGVRYTLTNASHVTLAVNRFNDKRASNADVTSYGVAYTYPFSKRTNLNVVLTKFNNSANGQAAPGGGGYAGGITASAGTDATSIAVGLRHSF
jgi:predicted porin